MREAVTKCKVAILSFLDDGPPSAFQTDWHMPTRRRKLAADTPNLLPVKSLPYYLLCSDKTGKREMASKSASQKSIVGQMKVHFAVGSSFAHIRPREKSIAEIMEQTEFKSRATFYKYIVKEEK